MTYKSFADQLEAETAHAAQTMEYTPASEWSERGEADPHAGHYDCERHQLTMGRFTDDELANGAVAAAKVRLGNRPYCTNALYRRGPDMLTLPELNDLADSIVDDMVFYD